MTSDKDLEAQWVKDLPYHLNKGPWYERAWNYIRYHITPQDLSIFSTSHLHLYYSIC